MNSNSINTPCVIRSAKTDPPVGCTYYVKVGEVPGLTVPNISSSSVSLPEFPLPMTLGMESILSDAKAVLANPCDQPSFKGYSGQQFIFVSKPSHPRQSQPQPQQQQQQQQQTQQQQQQQPFSFRSQGHQSVQFCSQQAPSNFTSTPQQPQYKYSPVLQQRHQQQQQQYQQLPSPQPPQQQQFIQNQIQFIPSGNQMVPSQQQQQQQQQFAQNQFQFGSGTNQFVMQQQQQQQQQQQPQQQLPPQQQQQQQQHQRQQMPIMYNPHPSASFKRKSASQPSQDTKTVVERAIAESSNQKLLDTPIMRVLLENLIECGTSPAGAAEGLIMYGENQQERVYAYAENFKRLEAAGFSRVIITYAMAYCDGDVNGAGSYLDMYAALGREYGITPQEFRYVVAIVGLDLSQAKKYGMAIMNIKKSNNGITLKDTFDMIAMYGLETFIG